MRLSTLAIGGTVTLLLALAGCGGGDGVSAGSVLNGSSAGSGSVVTSTPLSAVSADSPNSQDACPSGVSACSGATLGTAVGPIQLSKSGVQTVGFSTSDLLANNSNTAEAFGLQPLNQGFAEVRVLHDTDTNISAVDLLLSQLKLFWDGNSERPRIIENFGLKRGRVQLGEQGMSTLVALPPQGDGFWNNNPLTFSGTQDHYANNHYFERSATSCDTQDAACVAAANNGLRLTTGNWRSGGFEPNQIVGTRLHEDGATQGPDQMPLPVSKATAIRGTGATATHMWPAGSPKTPSVFKSGAVVASTIKSGAARLHSDSSPTLRLCLPAVALLTAAMRAAGTARMGK